jgi:CDP-diacylglycerol--glycerol-3-phosphate 3-phosphatidyltransferase/cardiolipin synthase
MSRWSNVAPPNLLSLSRVVLAAAFPFSDDRGRIALVGAAAATDFLDGWIARHGNWATRAGALIDPIADRVFALSAVGAFLVGGQLTVAQCFTMLLRDIMTAVGFVVARVVPWLRAVEFRARFLGKLVTTVQLLVLLAVLVAPYAVGPLVLVVGVLSVAAVVDYTLALWRARAR